MIAVDTFARDFETTAVLPEQLAIDIARLAYPDLDEASYWSSLAALAEFTAPRITQRHAGRRTAEEFLHAIHAELGFHGAVDGYYDPRNSLMPDVLERRQGLPIMLSLLCMAIGRRLNLVIEGMGFPFHFMSRYRDDHGVWLLDPFYGALVEPTELDAYLARIAGRPLQLAQGMWEPVTAQMLALRVLNNLRNAFMANSNQMMVLKTLDYLLAVQPQERHYWRERGLLHYALGDWEQAQHDLRYYLARSDNLLRILQHGDEAAAETDEDRRVLAIYRASGETLARIN